MPRPLQTIPVFRIDPDIYINDLFDSFVAPALNLPPSSTSTMHVHFYKHLVRDIIRQTLNDRFPAMSAENIFTVFIDVVKTLSIYPI